MAKKKAAKEKKGKKGRLHFKSHDIGKNLPYIFFLVLLAMCYIANAHYTEKRIRKIDKLKVEIKELTWTYMSVKSDAIYQGTYTNLKSQVKSSQLSNSGAPPQKLDSP